MTKQETINYYGISQSFIKQRKRNVRRILRSLVDQGEINQEALHGKALDLGSWIGASSDALRSLGANVTSIEQSEVQARKGVKLGLLDKDHLVIGKAEDCLDEVNDRVDFITFFGASQATDLTRVSELAEGCLNDGGFFLVTSMSEMEEIIEKLCARRGQRIKPNSNYWWDAIGYLLKK